MSKACHGKTIRFGALKKDRDWDEWVVKVYVNGRLDEGKTIRESEKRDAMDNLRASVAWATKQGYCVEVGRKKR